MKKLSALMEFRTTVKPRNMDIYTFDIEFPDGEILRDVVMASTRHESETLVHEKYSDVISINLIAVN